MDPDNSWYLNNHSNGQEEDLHWIVLLVDSKYVNEYIFKIHIQNTYF